MADYSTQSKVRGYPGYNVPELPWRRPSTCLREMYYSYATSRHCSTRLPKAGTSHDCCGDVIKMSVDDGASDQLTRLLTARLRSQLRLDPVKQKASSDSSPAVSSNLPPVVNWSENHVAQRLDNLWKQEAVKQRPAEKVRLLFALSSFNIDRSAQSLLYPRGVATDAETGEIYITDTGNRRILRFTRLGVYLGLIQQPTAAPDVAAGDGKTEEYRDVVPPQSDYYFREPTGIAVPSFGSSVVVCDRALRCIQIFYKAAECANCRLITSFPTVSQPFGVACSTEDQVIVSTTAGRVEIYDTSEASAVASALSQRDADEKMGLVVSKPEIEKLQPIRCILRKNFSVRGPHSGSCRGPSALYVAASPAKPEMVLVSDPVTSLVTWFRYDGVPVTEFQPRYSAAISGPALLSFVPAGAYVDAAGQIFLVDGLNGSVCVFDSDTGHMTRQLLPPSTSSGTAVDVKILKLAVDGSGSTQAVCVGPEGHLICTEYQLGLETPRKIRRYSRNRTIDPSDGSTFGGKTSGYDGDTPQHYVKVYKFRDCQCHGSKTNAKRASTTRS